MVMSFDFKTMAEKSGINGKGGEKVVAKLTEMCIRDREEIARLTGSTPVAVRTNLSRARKRVKEQFMIHSKVWN